MSVNDIDRTATEYTKVLVAFIIIVVVILGLVQLYDNVIIRTVFSAGCIGAILGIGLSYFVALEHFELKNDRS